MIYVPNFNLKLRLVTPVYDEKGEITELSYYPIVAWRLEKYGDEAYPVSVLCIDLEHALIFDPEQNQAIDVFREIVIENASEEEMINYLKKLEEND